MPMVSVFDLLAADPPEVVVEVVEATMILADLAQFRR
jgi:hypothetical protein